MDETSTSAASLRFLLLGDVGVGKSSFINTFTSTLANVLTNETSVESIARPVSSASPSPAAIKLDKVKVRAGPVLEHGQKASPFDDPMDLLPPKVSTPARELAFITLPGYSSTINPSSTLSMTDDYLNHHLHTVTSIFSPAIPSAQLAWFLIAGSRAHTLPTCAFYFVLYELKPIDILYMKMVHERVSLVPIIAKADTLSLNELWVLKKRMLRQLKMNGIKIHTFGSDMETIETMTEQRQWGAPPFVVSTRQDRYGHLFDSELKALVDLCLYQGVRHLQEEAAGKVITWKKAFGISGNASRTGVENVWAGKQTSKSIAVTTTAAAATVAVDTAVSTVKPPTSPVESRHMEQVLARNATISRPAPPLPTAQPQPQQQPQQQYQQQQQQQYQQYNPPSPTSTFDSQFSPATNTAVFTPPPPPASNGNNSQPTYNATAAAYAAPPSFNNGATTQGYTAPPSFPNPLAVNVTTANYMGLGVNAPVGPISPPPSGSHMSPTVYQPTTGYAPPPPRTTSNLTAAASASQVRLSAIHSGMPVDGSTRPNEIMDENMVKNVHAQIQADKDLGLDGRFMETYMGPSGANGLASPIDGPSRTSTATSANEIVKVEIPNSEKRDQPSQVTETITEPVHHQHQQLQHQMPPQTPFMLPGVLPGGFQSTAFLIPPSDIYQAAILSGAGGTNEYGEAIPDIWEAAELGDLATVQLHLNNGVSPDQRNNSRSTLLHRTAWQGVQPYAVMNLLISYGANVNLTNENGNTVLQNVLMKHDDPALIKLLLDNGAEAMIPNKEGMNTLEVAALFNKLESAKYLLENDLSSSEPQSILNALQRARSPDKKVMKALLKSWQGKDGERRRYELMERHRGPAPAIPQHSDAASIRSFETTKGDGKSSKWLKLKF
ncbi:septin 2 [Gryganskiella cystojenkinii]|nr:septin 2 [Gryganskiella cystojenkinii]